ncbi:hypothetical protein FA95DRAFT_1494475 [Auriscalpium vulgare]|uniref:Uncharacterized protein n=1 Tax=Auriscalpium vulgare TaxID=40419 RepID=A0ACB8RQB1_9AGAM|nr:hypothetical protein FA95DRAFT_1494475 [Auriscalpium vulgare]
MHRASLEPAVLEHVNSFLKALKSPLRGLTSTFTHISGELAILERLYYKGKNQHRSALFWQRVAETRKYGQRLQAMDVLALLENLRASFYGEREFVNAKVFKGAWSHYPDAPYLRNVLKSLKTSTLLLEKVRRVHVEDWSGR